MSTGGSTACGRSDARYSVGDTISNMAELNAALTALPERTRLEGSSIGLSRWVENGTLVGLNGETTAPHILFKFGGHYTVKHIPE